MWSGYVTTHTCLPESRVSGSSKEALRQAKDCKQHKQSHLEITNSLHTHRLNAVHNISKLVPWVTARHKVKVQKLCWGPKHLND